MSSDEIKKAEDDLLKKRRRFKGMMYLSSIFLFVWIIVVLIRIFRHFNHAIHHGFTTDRSISLASLIATVAIPWVLYLREKEDDIKSARLDDEMRNLTMKQTEAAIETRKLTERIKSLNQATEVISTRDRRDSLVHLIENESIDSHRLLAYSHEVYSFKNESDREMLNRSLRSNDLVAIPGSKRGIRLYREVESKELFSTYVNLFYIRFQKSNNHRFLGLDEALRKYSFNPKNPKDDRVLRTIATSTSMAQVVKVQIPEYYDYAKIINACPPLSYYYALQVNLKGRLRATRLKIYVGLLQELNKINEAISTGSSALNWYDNTVRELNKFDISPFYNLYSLGAPSDTTSSKAPPLAVLLDSYTAYTANMCNSYPDEASNYVNNVVKFISSVNSSFDRLGGSPTRANITGPRRKIEKSRMGNIQASIDRIRHSGRVDKDLVDKLDTLINRL